MSEYQVEHCGECVCEKYIGRRSVCNHPSVEPFNVANNVLNNTLHPWCPFRDEPLIVKLKSTVKVKDVELCTDCPGGKNGEFCDRHIKHCHEPYMDDKILYIDSNVMETDLDAIIADLRAAGEIVEVVE